MIEKIISDVIGCDLEQVTEDANFVNDLGADSLNIVELVMQIEENFDIEIPDDDAETLHTVADLKQYIEDYS